MKKINLSKIFYTFTLTFLLITLVISSPGMSKMANPVRGVTAVSAQSQPETEYLLRLPYVAKHPAPPQSIFGAETYKPTNPTISQSISDLNIQWLRYIAFSWADIEPVRVEPPDGPEYLWNTVNEDAILFTTQQGKNLIAIIRFTPAWAQKNPPDEFCGPIDENFLDEFGQFVEALVTRYSAPPYNIKYWEFGNEPDVDPSLVDPDSGYGCWGDLSDTLFYGGDHYAEMLKVAYQAVKAVDSRSKVIIGGLLLACDPEHMPPPWEDPNCVLAGKFFEGIVQKYGGAYFDIVAFHAYANYSYPLLMIRDIQNMNWDEGRGGVMVGKPAFLKSVMDRYGISKPMIATEISLMCSDSRETNPEKPYCQQPLPQEFLDDQAGFLITVFVRYWAMGILSGSWYAIEDVGWPRKNHTGLFDAAYIPKPIYFAYQFMTEKLGNVYFTNEFTQEQIGYTCLNDPALLPPCLRAYEFSATTHRTWVVWAEDQVDHLYTLPANVLTIAGIPQIWDKYGALVPVTNGQITIRDPIYIDLTY